MRAQRGGFVRATLGEELPEECPRISRKDRVKETVGEDEQVHAAIAYAPRALRVRTAYASVHT